MTKQVELTQVGKRPSIILYNNVSKWLWYDSIYEIEILFTTIGHFIQESQIRFN